MMVDPTSVSAFVADSIALLTELAERGEIDPWDVQVIEVIDRYLSGLAESHHNGRDGDVAELSQSGQAFLHASILVWLKANSLDSDLSTHNAEESEAAEPLENEILGGDSQKPQRLEQQLRRRAVAPLPKKRRVTLQELIDQLHLIGATIEAKTSRPRPRRPNAKARAQAARAIAELAHQENLTETADQLAQFLVEQWSQLVGEAEWLELEALLKIWSLPTLPKAAYLEADGNGSEEVVPRQPESDSGADRKHRVGVFWALLLLSSQSKVELSQEEFYQDLKIRTL